MCVADGALAAPALGDPTPPESSPDKRSRSSPSATPTRDDVFDAYTLADCVASMRVRGDLAGQRELAELRGLALPDGPKELTRERRASPPAG
jgi:hypothetical protein